MKSIIIDNAEFGIYVTELYKSTKKREQVLNSLSDVIADMVLSAACLIDDFVENKVQTDESNLIIPKGYVINLKIAKAIHQKSMWALFSLFLKGVKIQGLDIFLKQVMPYEASDEVILRASIEEGKGNFLLNVATALNSAVYETVNGAVYSRNIFADFITSNYLSHYVAEAKEKLK